MATTTTTTTSEFSLAWGNNGQYSAAASANNDDRGSSNLSASILEDFHLHIYRLCGLLLPLQQEDFIMCFDKRLGYIIRSAITVDWRKWTIYDIILFFFESNNMVLDRSLILLQLL